MAETAELQDTGQRIGDMLDRYYSVPILQDAAGNRFFATVDFSAVPLSPGDRFFRVTAAEAGRLDLIAWKAYRIPSLGFAIAWANNLFFPPRDLVEGLQLRIPPLDLVMAMQAGSRS